MPSTPPPDPLLALAVTQGAERLHRRFEGRFSRESIERLLHEAAGRMAGARISTWLPVLAERIVADQLRALAKIEGAPTSSRPHVVFLCVHNAGRSQMAAGWMRQIAGDRVEVFSGGSDPASTVNPLAVQAMGEVGIDIGGHLPQPWTDEVVRAADVVITMGCGDACPLVPGVRYEDWAVGDPAEQPIEVVRQIRDDLRTRVEQLAASVLQPAAQP